MVSVDSVGLCLRGTGQTSSYEGGGARRFYVLFLQSRHKKKFNEKGRLMTSSICLSDLLPLYTINFVIEEFR